MAPAKYVPLPQEPLPQLKTVAATFVQVLTTRRAGQSPADVLAATAPQLGTGFDQDRALTVATSLFPDPVSIGEIVYPQFGGLVPLGASARAASVLVVARQRLSASRSGTEVVRTFDVRLAVQDGLWKVVELADVGGEPVSRPKALDPRAARVLDDRRIELPDTARWDIYAGLVSLDLLDLLAGAAAVAPLSVAVLRRGHPVNVFGTNRRSNHTDGRAVDVWRIGGQPLVTTGASTGPAGALLRTAFADPRVAQIGSPSGSDLDGGGRRSFNDLVHTDHLHLAVRSSQTA